MAIGLLKQIIDTIFPLRCVQCQRDDCLLCERCRADFVCRNRQHCPYCETVTVYGAACVKHRECELEGVVALGWYANKTLQTLVRNWKYNYVREAEEVIESLLHTWLNQAQQLPTNNWIVVPVPLHPIRERQRGFNQAEVLSQIIAKELGVSQQNALRRTRHNLKPQADLPQEQRSKRALSFQVTEDVPKFVILVDDVYTSGRTMRVAAAELKRAGAEVVWGLVLARGD